MNRKPEIQKIKVNNGQELIAKAQEYKNSGGEWKLRERYWQIPNKDNYNSEYGKWGVVISDSQQEIEIYSENNKILRGENKSKNREGDSLINIIDRANSIKELIALFPEAKYQIHSTTERLDANTYIKLKRDDGEHCLYRYLVAENHWDLKWILNEYVRENETKIYNSANPRFSGWVEIVNGQDGNVYLYVGEKNDNGGREIKIGITRSEFEKASRDEDDLPQKALEDFWELFTLDRPRTPAEKKEYYSGSEGLENYWQTVERHWDQTCRNTLITLYKELTKAGEYWGNEPNEEIRDRERKAINWKLAKINQRLEEMKTNYPEWYNNYNKYCSDCGNRMCCDKEGHICGKRVENYGPIHIRGRNGQPISNFTKSTGRKNQINNIQKNQLLQYFLTHNISKITLVNDQLKIEYKGSPTAVPAVNNSELEKYRNLIENQPNHQLTLSDLQSNVNSNSTQNPSNRLAIGLFLGAGVVGLIGLAVYFWNRRKKRV